MSTARIPAADQSAERAGGHWILARLGKKVLRPGGRETTDFLLRNLPLAGGTVVEFAPGLGATARQILAAGPARYIGVDADPDACANVRTLLPVGPHEAVNVDASQTGLAQGMADAVIGEAMLTMQTDRHKLEIMTEAARLLKPGGRYGIHELCLIPDDAPEELKTTIRQDLARAIKVNARPITVPEWTELARQAGFEVVGVHRAEMLLLSARRNLRDEGVLGTLKIVLNVIRRPELRERVLTMRTTFRTHRRHLGAVGLVLQKAGTA